MWSNFIPITNTEGVDKKTYPEQKEDASNYSTGVISVWSLASDTFYHFRVFESKVVHVVLVLISHLVPFREEVSGSTTVITLTAATVSVTTIVLNEVVIILVCELILYST
jgi:hypothetical protein